MSRLSTRSLRRVTLPYWRLFAAGVREQSTYRLAALGGLVANLTFGFLKVTVLFATVRAAGGELKGYDVATMSTYVWLSQGLLGSVNLFGRTALATRVKDGDIAIDLLRPVNVQGVHLMTELGRSVWSLVPRGVPSVVIGALVVGMALPPGVIPYVLGALSLLLGMLVSAASVYLVAVAGFWLVETRGVQTFYMVDRGSWRACSCRSTWSRAGCAPSPRPPRSRR